MTERSQSEHCETIQGLRCTYTDPWVQTLSSRTGASTVVKRFLPLRRAGFDPARAVGSTADHEAGKGF